MKVSRQKIAKLISEVNDGLIFSVTFKKRSDQTVRTMVCRKGVKKHLKGGEVAYKPEDYDLIFVYDMQKEGYRSIPLDSVILTKIDGVEYEAL